MPSFLSKVFGRKKQDDKDDSAPLGGPYENISPTVSPSASNFPDSVTGSVGKDRDSGFPLFKSKFRAAATESHQKPDVVPHLALNLPSSLSPREDSPTRALDVVFEADFDSRFLLEDSVIGERRLSPTETLVLLRICARSISARGLETLGIMHPHWYSSSPDVQRKLISLYTHSLTAKSSSNTLSPSSSAILSTFESEVEYVRSPHDVAAVLRWALRHLKLDSGCFGREHGWYKAFFEEERAANYPPKAFSEYLSPRIPASHLDLLCATFEIFSSLAAHAEANGISGSKLAKFFGLWLLGGQRVEENDNWSNFYARWERTGRMLEHLFLARLRDEAINHRMPVRLMELVKKYPYGSPSDDDLLPRPRFSTRQYDAMLIRVETHLTTQRKLKHSHNKLISDAFEAETMVDEQEYKELWEQIKARRSSSGSDTPPSDCPDISRIFADETVRFLSLLPDENSAAGPTSYSLFKKSNRKRSLSLNDQDLPVTPPANNNGTAWHAKISTDSTKATTITPINRTGTRDWTQFSTSGFAESGTLGKRLAATLLDKDVELIVPTNSSANKHSRFATTPSVRKSMEISSGPTIASPKEEVPLASSVKIVQFSSIQLDEAFIDFWGDALTDPISSNWPPFVLCKLKPDVAGTTRLGKKVDWLVIERTFVRPATPEPQSPDALSECGGRRPTSPRPSVASQGTFSSAKKRFSLFNTSGSRTSLDKRFGVPSRKKANSLSNSKNLGKGPSAVRVGEMGEVLREEDEKETTKARPPSPKPRNSTEVDHKSQESAKTPVDATDEPAFPSFPMPPKEVGTDIQGSARKRFTDVELATAGIASAAATAAGVVASSDFSQVEPVPGPGVHQDRAPSPPVTSPQVDTTQGVPVDAEAAPLETVVEVADEPIAPPASSVKLQLDVQQLDVEVEPMPVKVMQEEADPAAGGPIPTVTVEQAAPTVELPTVEKATSADEPATENGMLGANLPAESESTGEPEAAVEAEAPELQERVTEATPAEEESKANEGPSEPPSDDLAQEEARLG